MVIAQLVVATLVDAAIAATVVAQFVIVARRDVLLVQRLRDRQTVASEHGVARIGDGARLPLVAATGDRLPA